MSESNNKSGWGVIEYAYLIALGLIFFVSLLIYSNYNLPFKENFLSFLLLSSLVVVLFLPLTTEINIFNILKIKKDIEKFKGEVNERFLFLQNTITNSIGVKQEANLNLFINALDQSNIIRLDERIIPELKYEIKSESQELQQKSIDKTVLRKFGKSIKELREKN